MDSCRRALFLFTGLDELAPSFGLFVEKDRRLKEEWRRIVEESARARAAPARVAANEVDDDPLSAALDAAEATSAKSLQVQQKRPRLEYEA